MKLLFKYGGQVSQELLRIDLTDYTFYDYITNNVDKDLLDDLEEERLNSLMMQISKDAKYDDIVFNDDRLVYLVVRMITKYPNIVQTYGELEWILTYRFIMTNYDKSLDGIDNVIRFVNLYIGYAFIGKNELTKEQAQELRSLAESVLMPIENNVYDNVLPLFVIQAIIEGVDIEEGEVVEVVEDLEEAKEIVELDEDDVNEEVGISEEEEEIIEDKEDVVERVKRILDEAEGDIEDFDDEIHQIHEEELEEMNEEEQEEEEKEEIIKQGKEGVSQVDEVKIFNWKDAIDDYQENIKKKLGTAKQRKQWQEAIEYYEELIEEMESQKMDIGGVVQNFGSPMLAQGMQGSLSGFGTSSTEMIF
jgi:hypothetical protein